MRDNRGFSLLELLIGVALATLLSLGFVSLAEGYQQVDRTLHQTLERDENLRLAPLLLSRFLWPWREHWLLLVVGLLAILDFTSTYILLELSQRDEVYESGLLAIWALDRGGFTFLLLVDIIAALVLSLAALTARYLYFRRGFKGYGRAAFVFLLAPYVVISSIASFNNIILLFR